MKTRWTAFLGFAAVVLVTVGMAWAASKYADGPVISPEEFYFGESVATASGSWRAAGDSMAAPSDYRINHVWLANSTGGQDIYIEFYADCDAAAIISASGDQVIHLTNNTDDGGQWSWDLDCEKVKLHPNSGTWQYFYSCVRYAQTGTIGCDSVTAWTQ